MDGWRTGVIDVDKKLVPDLDKKFKFSIEVDYVDLGWHLEHNWFSNAKYKEGFVLDAKRQLVRDPVSGRSVRDYSEPHLAEAWNEWQEDQREETPNAVIAPFQLYSDKALVNNKLRSVHPVKFALLNVAYSLRIKDLSTVAYIPVLDKPPDMPAPTWRLVKLAIHSKVLELLLAPLKDLSHTGKLMKDPSGVDRFVFPRFASYVVDAPEGADVMMVKGVPSEHPCEACLVSLQHLSDLNRRDAQRRTEEKMVDNYKRLTARQTKATRMELAKELSTQPIACALWGFKGQTGSGWGAITRVMGYEALHNEDLGVFLYIVMVMEPYLQEVKGGSVAPLMRLMNQNMGFMPPCGGCTALTKLIITSTLTLYMFLQRIHSCPCAEGSTSQTTATCKLRSTATSCRFCRT